LEEKGKFSYLFYRIPYSKIKSNFNKWEFVFDTTISRNPMKYQEMSNELGALLFLQSCLLSIDEQYKQSETSVIIVDNALNNSFIEHSLRIKNKVHIFS